MIVTESKHNRLSYINNEIGGRPYCYYLKVNFCITEPTSIQEEGTTKIGIGVYGSSKLGTTVTLERDVVDCLAEQDGTICIECLDGNIHGLLVIGQEQTGTRSGDSSYIICITHYIGKSCIICFESRSGVKTLRATR